MIPLLLILILKAIPAPPYHEGPVGEWRNSDGSVLTFYHDGLYTYDPGQVGTAGEAGNWKRTQ